MIAICALMPMIAFADEYECTMTHKIGRDMVPDTVHLTLNEDRMLGTVKDSMTALLSDTPFPAEITPTGLDQWQFRWELVGISGKWGGKRLISARLKYTLRLNTGLRSFTYEGRLADFESTNAGKGFCTKK